MPHLTRRGFSLVELLIAMVLLAIVTAALYRTLMTNQRVYQQQTQVIGLQQNLRAAAAILPQELREVDASDSDITAMSATSLSVRAHRWTAVMCTPPVTGLGAALGAQQLTNVPMIIRAQPFFGRSTGINTTSDSLFVRYEGDDGTRRDDGWVIGRPTNVVAGAAACPPLGLVPQAGQVVTVSLDFKGKPNFPTSIVNGDPVIGFEPVTYALDSIGTDWYVSLKNPSGTQPQPLIGPLLRNGLAFAYYDSTGVVTADRFKVARVDITLRAQTAQQIRARSGSNSLVRMVDSVLTSVALRNNRRY